jgi:hypothetical protein
LRRALAGAAVALAVELERTEVVLATGLRPVLTDVIALEPGVRR